MAASALMAFECLEEFSKSAAEKAVDHRKELEERVSAALEEGYQRGHAVGLAEGRSEADAAIKDFADSCAAEKNAARVVWLQDIGGRMADSFDTALADIARNLEVQVAELLRPWLLDKLHDRAMQEFLGAIDRIVVDGLAVEVRGPEALVDVVKERIGARCAVATEHCEDDASIVIKAAGTVISANFEDWMSRISEARHE